MKLESMYAQALYGIGEVNTPHAVFQNLKMALERRGHIKLLPKILQEYEKLHLHRARMQMYTTPSTESERTRVLLELYRKLLSTT